MKSLLVDPVKKSVTTVHAATYEERAKLIDATELGVHSVGDLTFLCDDTGRLRHSDTKAPGFKYLGVLFVGKVLVMGSDKRGNNAPPKCTGCDLAAAITWVSPSVITPSINAPLN